MATISDIAARAGVSKALVSRVINAKKGVSPENREKILSVMNEMNYRPNTLARSLVMQKTQTIGVVMDTLCMPYFFDMIYSLQDTGEKLGYNVVFCGGRSDIEIKQKYIDYFSSGRSDGLIIYGSHIRDQSIIRDIAARNSCFVLIEGNVPNIAVNNVLVDNFKGAYTATERFIKSGYKRICHFTGDLNYKAALDRLNGYVSAMQDYSVPIGPSAIVYTVFSEEAGYEGMKAVIGSGNIPDAIFFGSDKIAFGAIKAMYECGLTIPSDVAVIGFDDDLPRDLDIRYPKLTTLRQPLYQMGSESVIILVDSIRNPQMEKKVKVFEPELVVRDTCK